MRTLSDRICPVLLSVALLSCSTHSRSDFQTEKSEKNLAFSEISFAYRENYAQTAVRKLLKKFEEDDANNYRFDYTFNNAEIQVELRVPSKNINDILKADDDSAHIRLIFDKVKVSLKKDSQTCVAVSDGKIELAFANNGSWSIDDNDTTANIQPKDTCENIIGDEDYLNNILTKLRGLVANDILPGLNVQWPLPSKSYRYKISGSIDKADDAFFAVHIKMTEDTNSPWRHRFRIAYSHSESRCMDGFEREIVRSYPRLGDIQKSSALPLTVTVPEIFLRETASAFLFSGYGCLESDLSNKVFSTMTSDSYKRIFFYLNSDGRDFGATNDNALSFRHSGYELFEYEIESGTWKEKARNRGDFNLPFTIRIDSDPSGSKSYLKLKASDGTNPLLSRLIELPHLDVTEYLPPGIELKKISCQKDGICRLEFDFAENQTAISRTEHQ